MGCPIPYNQAKEKRSLAQRIMLISAITILSPINPQKSALRRKMTHVISTPKGLFFPFSDHK